MAEDITERGEATFAELLSYLWDTPVGELVIEGDPDHLLRFPDGFDVAAWKESTLRHFDDEEAGL